MAILPVEPSIMESDRDSEVQRRIDFYTDGSCNPSVRFGAWSVIILNGDRKEILTGQAQNTTHQRMELSAVINALTYIHDKKFTSHAIIIYTDSQYIAGLPGRKNRLKANNYITSKHTTLPNADLLDKFFNLCEGLPLKFVKVKAHQKVSDVKNYNREADMICRKIVRDNI